MSLLASLELVAAEQKKGAAQLIDHRHIRLSIAPLAVTINEIETMLARAEC